MIKESTLQKTRYLRALSRTLPFGVLSLVFGLFFLFKAPQIDDFIYLKECVKDVETKMYFNPKTKTRVEALFLSIGREKMDVFTQVSRHKKKILEILPSNHEFELWIDDEGRIRQAKHNGIILFKYKRFNILIFIYTIFGALCVIVSLIYLIKSPEELYGGDKEKAKGFWDPWNKYKQPNRWRNEE